MRAVVLVLLAGAFGWDIVPAPSIPVAAASSCSAGLTLTLHPGLPASVRHGPLPLARDIPHGPFNVAAPLYPGAQPLAPFVASPVPEYTDSPYLQTGVAEYHAPDSTSTVMAWYRSAFASCGWRAQGTMSTNASVLTDGITFVSSGNHNLTIEMTFGDTPSGGTYIAYAAEEITYPPRPAASYLHGLIRQVRIAVRQGLLREGQPVWHVVHLDLTDQSEINRLVRAINSIKEYYTKSSICSGGLRTTGPIWLSFVRPDGSVLHAFEIGPGPCQGLAVNGVRWLIDGGAVWDMAIRVMRHPQSGTTQSSHPAHRSRWVVKRVLNVQDVAALCASHPSAQFIASVRGYLTASPLQGPGGGFVGRLFAALNPHAFFAGDTKPFVQVWGAKTWSLSLNGRRLIFHGILACDASIGAVNLPGWQASITPDRYVIAKEE